MGNWGASAVTIHGRSRQQRYSKLADWEYVYQCARKAPDSLQVLGNGDVFSYVDWNKHKAECSELSSCMIARGALVKVCIAVNPHNPNPTHRHIVFWLLLLFT
jgi:tRNA-dihydrouridine synthase 3